MINNHYSENTNADKSSLRTMSFADQFIVSFLDSFDTHIVVQWIFFSIRSYLSIHTLKKNWIERVNMYKKIHGMDYEKN